MVWFPIEGDGNPSIDTNLDTHCFWIPIVGWMTTNHIPCFDRGIYGCVLKRCMPSEWPIHSGRSVGAGELEGTTADAE